MLQTGGSMSLGIPFGHADTGNVLVLDGPPSKAEVRAFIEPLWNQRKKAFDHYASVQVMVKQIAGMKGC